MNLLVVFVVLSYHQIISAYEILQGIGKLTSPVCFDVSDVPDCNTTLSENFQPQNPTAAGAEPETLVFLFTSKSPKKAEPLHACGGKLPPDSTYDPEADTEIFIHGWFDGVCRTFWMREVKEQLFLRGNYNVILVDWTWGNTPEYKTAATNCKVVGEQVGFIIKNIMDQTGCGPEKFHVIGHSFGAIASGFTGRSVRGLRRITALDPAYAPFGKCPPNQRLTYRDAQLVDVIHSNGDTCFALAIGDSRPLGHADFYPNGGQLQSSCYNYMIESLLKLDLFTVLGSLEPRLCSHLQAIQYYKQSINSKSCQYVGVASSSYDRFLQKGSRFCSSDWAVMGMDYELTHWKHNQRRKMFFLKTLDSCPYYDDSYLGKKRFPFNVSCTS